jgi:5,6-dimethylbenzimidazole synthase
MQDELPPVFDDAFRERLRTLFRWRRDVRRFAPTPVPPALLDELLATAALAPSVGLSEPWRFVIVDDPARRAAVRANFESCNAAALAAEPSDRAAAYARLKLSGLDEAPCHIAVFAEPDPVQGHGLGRRTMPQTADFSAVLAVHTLWLAARAAGLGVGWVSILDPAEIARVLDIANHLHLVAYLCVGYPLADADTPELARAGWACRQHAAPIRR